MNCLNNLLNGQGRLSQKLNFLFFINFMLPFVVHSHTDFLDILKIQNFYIKNIKNKILLINETSENIEEYTRAIKLYFTRTNYLTLVD